MQQCASVWGGRGKNNDQELNVPLHYATNNQPLENLEKSQGLEKGARNWPGVEAPVGTSESVWGMGAASVSEFETCRPAVTLPLVTPCWQR